MANAIDFVDRDELKGKEARGIGGKLISVKSTQWAEIMS